MEYLTFSLGKFTFDYPGLSSSQDSLNEQSNDDSRYNVQSLVVFIVNAIIFIVFIMAEVFVLTRIRFTLEKKSIVYLSTFSIVYLMRATHDGMREFLSKDVRDRAIYFFSPVHSITERVLMFTMYVFLMELIDLRVKLESVTY